jgi:hypothetical protein
MGNFLNDVLNAYVFNQPVQSNVKRRRVHAFDLYNNDPTHH